MPHSPTSGAHARKKTWYAKAKFQMLRLGLLFVQQQRVTRVAQAQPGPCVPRHPYTVSLSVRTGAAIEPRTPHRAGHCTTRTFNSNLPPVYAQKPENEAPLPLRRSPILLSRWLLALPSSHQPVQSAFDVRVRTFYGSPSSSFCRRATADEPPLLVPIGCCLAGAVGVAEKVEIGDVDAGGEAAPPVDGCPVKLMA